MMNPLQNDNKMKGMNDMCGRFSLTLELEEIELYLSDTFQIHRPLDMPFPRYNIAPTQQVLSVISDGEGYRAGPLTWGLVPPFAKDEKMGSRLINARAETIAEKPSFKHSFYHRRCLVLADGFYEWKKLNDKKIPYRIRIKDQPIFAFAGLWSKYTNPQGKNIFTCTIITTESNHFMSKIHHRMPVILTPEQQKLWLDPRIKDRDTLESLLVQYDDQLMDMYSVSTDVNNVKNDHPKLIQPVSYY